KCGSLPIRRTRSRPKSRVLTKRLVGGGAAYDAQVGPRLQARASGLGFGADSRTRGLLEQTRSKLSLDKLDLRTKIDYGSLPGRGVPFDPASVFRSRLAAEDPVNAGGSLFPGVCFGIAGNDFPIRLPPPPAQRCGGEILGGVPGATFQTGGAPCTRRDAQTS